MRTEYIWAIGGMVSGLVLGTIGGYFLGKKTVDDYWENVETQPDEIEENVEVFHIPEGVNETTNDGVKRYSTDDLKPDLTTVQNLVAMYDYTKGNEKDGALMDTVKQAIDPYICTPEEYVVDYDGYAHETCTWYATEKRLVNLDRDFEIMVDIEQHIGSEALKWLETDVWPEEAIYIVNPREEACYEILREEEGYEEDLEMWYKTNGGVQLE